MSALNDPCLVLNRNWVAFTFMPVSTAICNVMREMATILDPDNYYLMPFDEWLETHQPALDDKGQVVQSQDDETRWIKTTRGHIQAPSVIVLKKYGEIPPRKMTFNRPNLYKRDEYTCQYCGDEFTGSDLTIEHVMPRSRGGPTTWENCVAACSGCNRRKADMTPKEARMKLRKEPARPQLKYEIPVPRTGVKAAWMPFLSKVAV